MAGVNGVVLKGLGKVGYNCSTLFLHCYFFFFFCHTHADYDNLERNKWMTKGSKCCHKMKMYDPRHLTAQMLFVLAGSWL